MASMEPHRPMLMAFDCDSALNDFALMHISNALDVAVPGYGHPLNLNQKSKQKINQMNISKAHSMLALT